MQGHARLMQELQQWATHIHPHLCWSPTVYTCQLQGGSQALQERVAILEAALQQQDRQVEKLQAGAKRHMESSLRQSTARRSLQQASQKEDKLQQQMSRLETELAASRRSAVLPCAVL